MFMDIISQVKKAIKLTEEKDYKSAEKIYLEILNLSKDNPTILSLLGLLYFNSGKVKKAKQILLKSDKLKPNNPTTIESLGFVFHYLGDYRKASYYFQSIIDKTNNFEVYDKYINSLIELKSNSKAYELSKTAHQKFPLKKEFLAHIVSTSIYTGRFDEAIKTAQTLMARFPKESISWLKQGLLQEIYYHNIEDAIKCYKLEGKYGDKIGSYYNQAICYNKLKKNKKAMYYIKQAIKYGGINSSLCFTLATIFFCQRNLKKGYLYYNYKNSFPSNDPNLKKIKNLWDGKQYKDETLLVYCDQGIGDCLMFSRYFPFLEKKFKKIKVVLHKSLAKLMKRSFKDYKKIEFYEQGKRFPTSDKMTIMSNLPYTLKMETKFPFADKYIISDQEKREEYKEKYFKTDKLKVGICWEAGAAGIREQLNRTLHISILDEILKMKDIQFYSFQYKPILDDYKNYKNLIPLGDSFKDFDDTAGALENLDIMITVDTSVAHLSGALGVKTFMLLPYCTDWRWFDDTKTTAWYNSMKLFKQVDNVFWDKEISDIKGELIKISNSKK
jgi:hypothetical protein